MTAMALTLYYCIKHERCTPNELEVEPSTTLFILYRLDQPANLSILPEESLLQRTTESLESLEPLEPADAVQDVITEDALDKDKKLIHLVVVHRTAAISILAKRPSLSVQDKNSPPKRMRMQKVASIPPFTVARISVLASIQNDSEDRVLNDRPKTNMDIAPIALLYEGFGQFQDEFSACEGPFQLDITRTVNLINLMTKFADAMCTSYATEDERCTKALPLLNEISSIVVDDICPSEIPRCNACTDGYSVSATGACDLVVEFRRDGDSGSDAVAQGVSYLAHRHRDTVEKNVANEHVYDEWRVPALLITVVGATISFHGLVVLGNHRIVPLTPKLTLTNPNVEPEFRQQVIRAFMAAVKVRRRIRDDTETMLREADRLPVLTLEQMRFPNISSVTTAQHGSQARTDFTIKKSLPPSHNRFLYCAKTPEGSDILVKCTLRYSRELYEFCAEREHAPKLLGFERIPGGWFIVAMELVKGELLCIRDTYRSEWKAGLEGVVNQFHDAGMVHGDLRDVNLLISDTNETKAIILDFDWGGKAGEVYYPLCEPSSGYRLDRHAVLGDYRRR
ncbi:uncharacterized protein LAESUDRAFT_748334 [Laetiporus sulphureus 93-53]|uniref:Protein kinase domain-containing protein n=1 Tax=Laetiporus sulphureus 93-53 TaxID=1314785 RepID=A0A165FKF2_9APHY|nr:uncharacterized protein LAESUDRAFT_748334 [Laetiporus sulphureus 93-53]KZT09106.1 hypothetical protein LAESUDRAFT_748334 [Laetiporus sulphureus 93-53]